MKNHFLIYFIFILTLLSCTNNQEEITKLNSFLHSNYEFNRRNLNKYRGGYYQMINEQPSRKIEKLNQLDSIYENLIANIDIAILNKQMNLDKIVSDYNSISATIPEIVDFRKDYLLGQEIFENLEGQNTNSTELKLNCIKNKLVISMAYAFEFASRQLLAVDGIYEVKVDSILLTHNRNAIKLTLTSKYGQDIKKNRHILINAIKFNGQEKKIDFKLKENYAFADIEFDSLTKGTYRISGFLRLYEREGKIDIPFEREFKSE